MHSKNNELHADTTDSLRLVRVHRMAASKLIPESVAKRFAESSQAGAIVASPDEISWVTHSSSVESLNEPTKVASTRPELLSESVMTVPTLSQAIENGDYSLEKAELAIRKLVLAEQSWAKMQPHAWHIYERIAQPEIAAKLAELAYLHGTIEEFAAALVRLSASGKHFYFLIQKKIRDHLVPRLWAHGSVSVLQSLLEQKLFRPYLIPIEHLFMFWQYYQNDHPNDAYQYFSRYRFDILQAAGENSSFLNIEGGSFYFVAGKLAFICEDFKEARLLLAKVTPDDKDHQNALDLLVTFDPDMDASEYAAYEKQLSGASDWEERLRLLRRYLESCVQTLGLRHSQRAALNRMLFEPLKWLPETPFAWGKLSELLTEYCEAESMLPNLFYTYKEHVSQFHEPLLEKALWSPLLKLNSGDTAQKNYWRSLALVHEYVAIGPTGEHLLWEARSLHAKAWMQIKCDDAVSWKDVLKKTSQGVAKLEHLDEKKRNLLLAQLGVAGHQLDVDPENIEIYLDSLGHHLPHQGVVTLFREIAGARDEASLEKRLIHKYADTRYYSNNDLARLWVLGRKLGDYDLSLRVAGVLKARKVLAPNVEQMWVLTGEMRREQPIKAIESAHLLSFITEGLSEQEKQIVDCMFTIGPKIPELLALVCKDIMPRRGGFSYGAGASPYHKDVEKAVAQLCVPANKGKAFQQRMESSTIVIPPFASAMPENRWSQTFLALSDRLGVSSWRWQLSLLGSRLEGVFSKAHRGLDQRLLPVKVGKWLRQLEPMQRKAWYDLAGLSKRLDDDQASYYLGLAMVRLATAMTNQHTLALESLSQMHVGLDMRWDLEKWIVSDAYRELRSHLGTAYKLQIPQATSLDPLTSA